MTQNPPANTPRITPYLYYEDVAGALEWLARTFGFRERAEETLRSPDGKVIHSAMELDDGLIMLGTPENFENPKRHGKLNQILYVYVDDVDKHLEHAREAGANILSGPEDMFYGDRRYSAEDLEGHHWCFAQHVRDVAPQDWKPTGHS